MSSRYAADTSVTTDRSLGEIRKLLTRYGADGFGFGEDAGRAAVQFRMRDRLIRIVVALPRRDARAITHTATGRVRAKSQQDAEYEQQVRSRWRALVLIIKAKMEAVASGIVDFDTEWLGYVQLPNGETAGEWMAPQIETIYQTHQMPSLLPGATMTARLLGPGDEQWD